MELPLSGKTLSMHLFSTIIYYIDLEIDQLDLSANKETVTESECPEDLMHKTAVMKL